MPTVDELVIKFIGNSKPLFNELNNADSKINKFVKNARVAIGGIFAIGGITSFGKDLIRVTDATGKFAKSIGEDVESVYKLQEVVKRAGGTIEGFRSSISSLSGKMTEARIKGGDSAILFQRMGVAVSDTTGRLRSGTDVMLDLNKQFQNFSKTEQIGFGKQLGLDSGTIKMLQMAPKELDNLLIRQNKLGALTQDQADKSARLNDLFKDFNQAIQIMSLHILTALSPALELITNFFIEIISFVKSNKVFVISFFSALASVILYNVVPAMFLMAKATIIAFAPFYGIGIIIAGAVAFIALLIDDIIHFMNGNDSLIGHILKNLETWYKAFLGFFVKIKTNIINVFNEIKNNIKGFVQPIIDGLIGAFNGLKTQLANIIKPIQEALMPLTKIFDSVGGFFGGGTKLASQGASSSNSSSSQMSVGVVNVQSTGDPKKDGEKVVDGMKQGWFSFNDKNVGGRKS